MSATDEQQPQQEPTPQATSPAAAQEEPQAEPQEEPGHVDTEEDKALKAELERLEAQQHDIDVDYHSLVEESARRDDAEQQLAALRQERDAAEKEQEEERAVTEPLEARVDAVAKNVEMYPRIRSLEEDFNKQPDFKQFWDQVVKETDLEQLISEQPEDGCPADEVKDRIDQASSQFNANVTQLKKILEEQENIVRSYDEQVQGTIEVLKKELAQELKRLKARRQKLQIVAREQHYHYRRGTHVKAKTIDHKMKDQFLDLEHAKDDHNKLSERIHDQDGQLEFARKELEGLRKDHRHFLERSAQEKAAISLNIQALEQEVEEVNWELRALTEENEQLTTLRQKLIRVHAQCREQLKQ